MATQALSRARRDRGNNYIVTSLRYVSAFLWPLTLAATAHATAGAIQYRDARGRIVAREADLDLPAAWDGPARLRFGEDELSTRSYRGRDGRLALAFARLPYADGGAQILVLVGDYTAGQRYFGEAFTTTATTDPDQAASLALSQGAATPTDGRFQHQGSFYFGSGRTINGVPVVTGRPADPTNPCPYGPCWTDAGVGRHLEYYAGGPLQSPGGPYPPAGFMRGVPYEWTRQGQLDAQYVGTLRARELAYATYPYDNWGWGFYLFPWAAVWL
jgi:hypothetical protein